MKTYKVMMLGTSGAGKTVFLASMYDTLAIPRKEIGFSLSCDDVQRGLLNNLYKTVVDTSGEWPPHTGRNRTRTWTFTCHVQSRDLHDYPMLQFTYLDYAGGILTQPEEGETGLYEEIKQADVLLAMLDGHEILKLMRENENSNFVFNELKSVLQIIAHRPQPVHFLITKWDLLEGQFSLEAIRARLLEIDLFRQTVLNRKERYTTRLIPVSSVGKDFARLETLTNGSVIMRKLPGAKPHPFQVEMPLACVLPDVLQRQLQDLAEVLGAKDSDLTRARRTIYFLNLIQRALPMLRMAQTSARLFAGKRAADKKKESGESPEKKKAFDYIFEVVNQGLDLLVPFAEVLLNNHKESTEGREKQLSSEHEERLKHIDSQQSASKYLIESFVLLQNQLEQAFPASNLSTVAEESVAQ